MKNKQSYLEPEMEIIRFEEADIIATSSLLDEDELPPLVIK